jgi:transglutaminase-like putative cysteine protease
MRIRLQHRTAYIYDRPAASIIQVLRLTPRNTEGQHVRHWRIDLDQDVQMLQNEDAFGNVVNTLSFSRPLDDLCVAVKGEIETRDTHGVVRGAIERFQPGVFLRETPQTQPVTAIRKFARDTGGTGDTLDKLHKILDTLHAEMEWDPQDTDIALTAGAAFAAGRGTPKDIAHVFIAAARSLDVPARYAAGYLLNGHAEGGWRGSVHAWAEAYVEDIGWIGFDPAVGMSPAESHIRVSMALDCLGAAPVRSTYQGSAEERLEVTVLADHADHPGYQHQ